MLTFSAKPHRSKPFIAERFELYVAGKELVNAYSELNSPDIQRKFFQKQVINNKGSGEVPETDEEFIRALEYGLPPTGGFGLGIDRLVMILTNQSRIKDVMLFPVLKPLTEKLSKSENDLEVESDEE